MANHLLVTNLDKVYSSGGAKHGTCPKCGHKNGLNPFRFDQLSHATYKLTSHKVIHHKCKKCLWQGYVLINSDSRFVNFTTNLGFYFFWILLLLSVPVTIVAVIF